MASRTLVAGEWIPLDLLLEKPFRDDAPFIPEAVERGGLAVGEVNRGGSTRVATICSTRSTAEARSTGASSKVRAFVSSATPMRIAHPRSRSWRRPSPSPPGHSDYLNLTLHVQEGRLVDVAIRNRDTNLILGLRPPHASSSPWSHQSRGEAGADETTRNAKLDN